MRDIMNHLGYKSRKKFRLNYIKPLLEEGLLSMTIPDKPNHQEQKYFSSTTGVFFESKIEYEDENTQETHNKTTQKTHNKSDNSQNTNVIIQENAQKTPRKHPENTQKTPRKKYCRLSRKILMLHVLNWLYH